MVVNRYTRETRALMRKREQIDKHREAIKNLERDLEPMSKTAARAEAKNKAQLEQEILNADEFIKVSNLVLRKSLRQLQATSKNPDKPVLEMMIAGVCAKVITNGDMSKLDLLLNRLIGKVKDQVEHSGNNPVQVNITLPSNGREVTNG